MAKLAKELKVVLPGGWTVHTLCKQLKLGREL
jgi:hypothetical protein